MVEKGIVMLVQAGLPTPTIGGFMAQLPKGAALPNWTHRVVSQSNIYGLQSPSGLNMRRLQIDCYADPAKAADVITLSTSIDNILNGFSGNLPDGETHVDSCLQSDVIDFFDDATRGFRRMLEYEIWYSKLAIVAGIFGSAPLTFGTIPDLGELSLTFSLPGAVVGGAVVPSWPSTLEVGLHGIMFVSAPDVITVRLDNISGDPITPAVQVFGATVGVGSMPITSSLTFPSITDGGSVTQTFSAPGATIGQGVVPAWPATLEVGLVGIMFVSAPSVMSVRLDNLSGFPITPAVQVFGAALI